MVSGNGGLCLSLPVPRRQMQSREPCWLLQSFVELMALSCRVETPFPGHLGKGSVEAKWRFVPAVGFFDSCMVPCLCLGLSPFPSGAGKHSTAGHSTNPAMQPGASALAPSNVLFGMTSQGWYVLCFMKGPKSCEVGAADLLEI